MPTDEIHEAASRRIRFALKIGFVPHDGLVKDVVEWLIDEHDEDVARAAAEAVLPDILREHLAEMKTWPALTDCDRLDAAFEELNARGIMARRDWTCCGNCGRAEMPDEFDRLDGQWEGKPIIGYIFYHQQDTENAAEQYGLSFNFGSCESIDDEQEYVAKCLEVARALQDALTSRGLKVTWSGTYAQRPHVQLNWQRRARPKRFCGDNASGSC